MSDKLSYANNLARAKLNEIAECFIPEAKLTLVVRIPGNDEADFVLTSDQLPEAIEALQRRHKNEPPENQAQGEDESRDRLLRCLEVLRGYNLDIKYERINYRPDDHIQVIDKALVAFQDLLTRQVPDGWQLVPKKVTQEMQRAYFAVIDKNLDRVNTDPYFGRHDSMKEAYSAMLASAPRAGE